MMPGVCYEIDPDYELAPRGGSIARDLILEPGEVRDLGDVQIKPPR